MYLKPDILHKENWNLLSQKQKNDLNYFLKSGKGLDNIKNHLNITLMALYIAVIREKIDLVDVLLDDLSDGNVKKIKPEHINQILNYAIKNTNEDLILSIIKKFKGRLKHDSGLIIWSTNLGFLKLTKQLLDVSNKENINNSLYLAVEMHNENMVKTILSYKDELDVEISLEKSLIQNDFLISKILIDEIIKRKSERGSKIIFANMLEKMCHYNDKKEAVDLLFDLVESDALVEIEKNVTNNSLIKTNTRNYLMKRIKIKKDKYYLGKEIKNKSKNGLKKRVL